ncbi:MAG TPA: hypothetical protein VFS05_07150 [Gemmatimonadaceae bacterium]|nr:hypothetical protein [Gemmatimonadaceae bacterium]
MSRPATRAERRRDAIAIALLLGGLACFAFAFVGFRALAGHEATMDVPLEQGQKASEIFMRHFFFAVAGLALVLAGLGTAVWSYLRRRREQLQS